MSEKLLQKQILDWLRLNGYFAFKVNTTGIYRKSTDSWIKNPMRGVSDIIALKDGNMVCIEVKYGKNKPSKEQVEFIENIAKHGGTGIVVYSLDEAIFYLKKFEVIWDNKL